jgi:hypothetical protein
MGRREGLKSVDLLKRIDGELSAREGNIPDTANASAVALLEPLTLVHNEGLGSPVGIKHVKERSAIAPLPQLGDPHPENRVVLQCEQQALLLS